MKRRQLLAGLLAGVALPGGVFAQTAEDQVVNQLKRQGYQRITLGRTLLGRTRIVATGPRGRREIVLNPSTGAILRDYVDRSDRGRDSDDRDPMTTVTTTAMMTTMTGTMTTTAGAAAVRTAVGMTTGTMTTTAAAMTMMMTMTTDCASTKALVRL